VACGGRPRDEGFVALCREERWGRGGWRGVACRGKDVAEDERIGGSSTLATSQEKIQCRIGQRRRG